MLFSIFLRYVVVFVNCEESYEYSLVIGRVKGKVWF